VQGAAAHRLLLLPLLFFIPFNSFTLKRHLQHKATSLTVQCKTCKGLLPIACNCCQQFVLFKFLLIYSFTLAPLLH